MKPFLLTTSMPVGLSGCRFGITAHNEEDARVQFREAYGEGPEIETLEAVKSVEDLDEGHIRPNMGDFFRRGIWYPAEAGMRS